MIEKTQSRNRAGFQVPIGPGGIPVQMQASWTDFKWL
jgi:hypothetical protein